ncbi:hypothetical protein ACVW19_005712 [Streptomyces sp. TE5632]
MVEVFSHQSLRRAASRAFSRATFAYSSRLRSLPLGARAARRWCLRIRARSRVVSWGQFSFCPSDRAAVIVTPRSMPTTSPVPGAPIGSGLTAKAMCHCWLRKVTRKVFATGSAVRVRRKRTQPQPGTFTRAHRRLSFCTTTERPMTCRPWAFSLGVPSGPDSGTRSVPMTRKPSCTCFLRQVGSPNPEANRAFLALAKSFRAHPMSPRLVPGRDRPCRNRPGSELS